MLVAIYIMRLKITNWLWAFASNSNKTRRAYLLSLSLWIKREEVTNFFLLNKAEEVTFVWVLAVLLAVNGVTCRNRLGRSPREGLIVPEAMKPALRSLHSLLTLKRQRAVSSEQITSVLKSSTLWRRVPILRRHNNSVKDRGKAFLAATSCHYCALFSLGGDFRPSQFPFPLSAAHLNFPAFSSGRHAGNCWGEFRGG